MLWCSWGDLVSLLAAYFFSTAQEYDPSWRTRPHRCWFPHLSHQDKERLEKYQHLCLWIILPLEDCYSKRLSTLGICTITKYLEDLCRQYVAKLHRRDHPLNLLIPRRTHNKRTGKVNTLKFRCSLLRKSLFHTYTWFFNCTLLPKMTYIMLDFSFHIVNMVSLAQCLHIDQ